MRKSFFIPDNYDTMKTIYKSETGKKRILELYDQQLKRLTVPYRDVSIQTSYGRTHLIETGSLKGEPLLVFHGGNATTAYNLLACDFLFSDFHIYAVDTIGHPGKSAETSLSAFGYDKFFGRTELMNVLEITASPASELIKKMLESEIIYPMKGKGKGKYLFKRK